MAQRKKTTQKKTTRKSKKKAPKVKLNNKAVAALTAAIVVLCGVFLLLNFAFNTEIKNKEKTQVTVTEKTTANSTKVQSSSKNQTSSKVQNPSKTQTDVKPAADSSKKTTVASEKKPASTVSSSKTSSQSASGTVSSAKNQTSVKTAEPSAASVTNKTVETSKAASASNKTSASVTTEIKSSDVRLASVDTSSSVKPDKPLPPKYDIPQAARSGIKIAFVIDDAGLNVANVKRYTSLPFPITIAVIPKLVHSKDCAYVVRSARQELILHQPMQSVDLNINPGPGAITPDMSTYDIARLIKENIDEIGPNVKGINNHEGSLITANAIKIGAVLDVADEKGVYFLDSRTNVETKAPQAALERDMSIYERDVFIDNVISKEAMVKEILRGIGIANKKGKVIMIGHVDKSVNILPDLLNEMYPYLKQKGYVVTTVSGL